MIDERTMTNKIKLERWIHTSMREYYASEQVDPLLIDFMSGKIAERLPKHVHLAHNRRKRAVEIGLLILLTILNLIIITAVFLV